jgi:hypothetical protein
MQPLKRPKSYVLKGEGAVNVLEAYVAEMKENRPDELTETQAEALVKLAEGLITAIAAEDMTELSTKFTFKHAIGDLFSVLKGSLSQIDSSEPQDLLREEAHYHPQPIRIM